MTPTQLDRIRRRHNNSPIGDWRLEPIPNVTAFVTIKDHTGAVAPDITPDDAYQIQAAHSDRAKLLADNERLRAQLAEVRRDRAAVKKQLAHARDASAAKTERHAAARDRWQEERRWLLDGVGADTSIAPYRYALASVVNPPWEVRPVGGVTCARSNWIAVGDLIRYRSMVDDIDISPSKRTRGVSRRVNVDAA